MSLSINYKNTLNFLNEYELDYMKELAYSSNDKLKNKKPC